MAEKNIPLTYIHFSNSSILFIWNSNKIHLRLQSHQKYLTAANVDHPIARDENMIPRRPFIFTKMDKPARPMTGSKQYPTKKSSI